MWINILETIWNDVSKKYPEPDEEVLLALLYFEENPVYVYKLGFYCDETKKFYSNEENEKGDVEELNHVKYWMKIVEPR